MELTRREDVTPAEAVPDRARVRLVEAEGALAGLGPLLVAVVEAGASDLHLRAGQRPRMRVSGELVDLGEVLSPAQVSAMVEASMQPQARPDLVTTYLEQLEADYAVVLPGTGRFRAHAFRSAGTDACVLRLIGDTPRSLASLEMPPVVGELALRPRGLVLVTGPTGSGKTTTLAAMVDEVNRARAAHVLTLEDPIEVVHRSRRATVTQRELGSDTRSWAGALRAAMRQDPDVIMVGEMRDADTVHLALSAAETGHLVLSTLHTSDVLETIQRIIDFFPPHEQPRVRAALATSLQGVICQRLVPRADGQGRACVLEIAVADGRVAAAVADPERTAEIPDIVAEGGYSGMQAFDQHLLRLVLDGTVDPAVASATASRPHDFSVMLRRAGWRPEGAPSVPAPARGDHDVRAEPAGRPGYADRTGHSGSAGDPGSFGYSGHPSSSDHPHHSGHSGRFDRTDPLGGHL